VYSNASIVDINQRITNCRTILDQLHIESPLRLQINQEIESYQRQIESCRRQIINQNHIVTTGTLSAGMNGALEEGNFDIYICYTSFYHAYLYRLCD
jgi:glutamate mutase epsilon subunit